MDTGGIEDEKLCKVYQLARLEVCATQPSCHATTIRMTSAVGETMLPPRNQTVTQHPSGT